MVGSAVFLPWHFPAKKPCQVELRELKDELSRLMEVNTCDFERETNEKAPLNLMVNSLSFSHS